MKKIPVPVAVNNRHVHLSKDDARTLFGEHHQFSSDPSQDKLLWPGHSLWKEKVTLAGPTGTISTVTVLGPLEKTSVEMSVADAYRLGLQPQNVKAKKFGPGVTLIGPKGSVFLATERAGHGRWLLASRSHADKHGLKNGMKVEARVGEGEWATSFHGVEVIVDENSGDRWALYLDADTASATSASTGDIGHIRVVTDQS
jgi:putative phosphotransacetylase